MNNNEFKDTHLINQAVSNSEKNSIYLMKNLKEGALNKSILNKSDFPHDLNGNVVDEVKNSKLDTVLSNFHTDRVDILKIDVEGFELEVLESAREVLQKTRYLHIELNFEEYSISDFLEFCQHLKYHANSSTAGSLVLGTQQKWEIFCLN